MLSLFYSVVMFVSILRSWHFFPNRFDDIINRTFIDFYIVSLAPLIL